MDKKMKRAVKSQMKCNSPQRTSGGSKKFVVKACSGGKKRLSVLVTLT